MELLEVEKEVICGKKITVFTIHGDEGPEKYLIGVQVSKILRRQTFNLYRSLKLKGVGVIRATPQQVGFLLRTQSLPPNSHSVSLIPYKGAKDFILENFKGKIEEPAPTASKSASPRPVTTTSTPTPAPTPAPAPTRSPTPLLTPQPTQQQAAQLQKILQLQRLKRAYEREYAAYSSGNESSSSLSSSAALSSDSEADHYRQKRRPTTTLPAYQSPVLPTDELKRHQRPAMMTNPLAVGAPKRSSVAPELEAGEVLATFFRRTHQQPSTQIPASQTKNSRTIPPFAPPLAKSLPPTAHFPHHQKLTLPPISSLPSTISSSLPLSSMAPVLPTITTPEPQAQVKRNPKHDLSFLLG